MQERCRKLGISQKYDEGIKNKAKRKTQNYSKTITAGKRTRYKALAKSPLSGSNNEMHFRDTLALVIGDYFSEKKFEVIVGINNVGILNGKEIDIPVIVYNNEDDVYYKFAVEYNGETFHGEDRDKEKIKILDEKKWYYCLVLETNADLRKHMDEYMIHRAREMSKKFVS